MTTTERSLTVFNKASFAATAAAAFAATENNFNCSAGAVRKQLRTPIGVWSWSCWWWHANWNISKGEQTQDRERAREGIKECKKRVESKHW